MLITNEIKLKWHGSNREYYEKLGYTYGGLKKEFIVKTNELPNSSIYKVTVICDRCKKEFSTKYCNYIEKKNKYDEDLCRICRTKDSNVKKYGVDNVAKSKEIKEKTIKTNLKKYGTNYGLSNNEVRNKIKNTCLEKYGVENVFQAEEIKEKIKQTNLKNYGYENNLCDPEQRKQAIINSRKTLYENGTTMCSKQQKYLHNLLGGELNYPIDWYSLDIAFPKEMLYIEYDGSGHDLGVKRGYITAQQFNEKELKRDNHLKNKGWKLIRIISNKDYLPDDDSIINAINIAKNKLKDFYYCKINIDNETIEINGNVEKILFNNLRRL